jgi:NAD+ synthase (glutamine-hydrolysing)
MRIALAQINPTVGDLAGNRRRIHDAYAQARAKGADLVVLPELALVGYPPLDLLARDDFVRAIERNVHELAAEISSPVLLLGAVLPNPETTGRPIQNVAVLISKGRIQSVHAKTRLPTYDVFDEDRYFEPAQTRSVATVGKTRVGIVVCEDIWPGPERGRTRYQNDPVADLAGQGIDVLINLSASPFHAGRCREREQLLAEIATRIGKPVLLVNQVGGNDSLIFDGASLAVSPDGSVRMRARSFNEDLVLFDLAAGEGDLRDPPPDGPQELAEALILGLADYLKKCGFTRVVLGLSGGIDSAVVATLAVKALGPSNVRALSMPSPYSAGFSQADAEELAKRLGIDCFRTPIDAILDTYRQQLHAALGPIELSLTDENLQARIRGALVMAHANSLGALALATGNKSELATGYCTLYGDMAGGLAPLGDLLKRQVYALAEYFNHPDEIIPRRIIDRPPSAELRPNQTDQDSLPPYPVLDEILDLFVTEGLDPEQITARGQDPRVVAEVIRLLEISEFKRRQAAPVLRVTRRAFGAGRQIPIARGQSRRA